LKELSLRSDEMSKEIKVIFNDIWRQCQSQHKASAILLTLKLVQGLLKLKVDRELKLKDDTLSSFLAFFPHCNPLNTMLHAVM